MGDKSDEGEERKLAISIGGFSRYLQKVD